MVERSRTKDEMFMVKLCEEASRNPDIEDPIDRYHIGTLVGLHPKAVDTICNLLAQANFIKKHGQAGVSITPHGMKLVDAILEK